MATILITLSFTLLGPAQEINARQFSALIQGLHAPIRDVTFAYEGTCRPGPLGQSMQLELDPFVEDYQGRYSYRSDGGAFLDFYQKGPKADDRQTHSLLQNMSGFSSLKAVPDLKKMSFQPPRGALSQTKGGSPGALNRPGSPERILYLWYFQGLSDPASMHYEFQGWEEVDGHRCLRVEIDSSRGSKERSPSRLRFWIDMNRGGHPLRVEYIRRSQVSMRCDNIQLKQFQDRNGRWVWLPISGQAGVVRWPSPSDPSQFIYHTEPVLVESYNIITGSVVLNQGLDQADLSLKSIAKKYPEFGDFKGDQKQRARPIRTDPKGVQQRLDEALADADSKARRLEASAPERTSWEWSNILSVGLPMLGVVLLAWAGIWKWRSVAR